MRRTGQGSARSRGTSVHAEVLVDLAVAVVVHLVETGVDRTRQDLFEAATGPAPRRVAELVAGHTDAETPGVGRPRVAQAAIARRALTALVDRAVAVVVDLVAALHRGQSRDGTAAGEDAGANRGPDTGASASAAPVDAGAARDAGRRVGGDVRAIGSRDIGRRRRVGGVAVRARVRGGGVRGVHGSVDGRGGVRRRLRVSSGERRALLTGRMSDADPAPLGGAHDPAVGTGAIAGGVVPRCGLERIAAGAEHRPRRRRELSLTDRSAAKGDEEGERETLGS